jgi:hypothetical protein
MADNGKGEAGRQRRENPSVSLGKLVDDQKTSDYEGVTLDVQEVTSF